MHLSAIVFLVACLAFSFEFAHPFAAPKMGFLLVLASILKWRPRLDFSWQRYVLLAWGLWPVLQPTIPLDPLAAIHDRSLWVFYLLFAWLVAPLSREYREALAKALGWAAMLTSVYSVCQWLGWDWVTLETPGQPTSFFGNPNFAGHFLLLTWFLAQFTSKKWALWGYGLMAVGICLSGSRSVMGLWILALAFQGFRKRYLRTWILMAMGLVLISGFILNWKEIKTFGSFLSEPESYITQYRQQPELIADRDRWFRGKRLSLMARVALYGNSSFLLAKAPWFGVGAGQFHVEYPAVSQSVLPDLQLSDVYRAHSVHNSLLELAILHGLPWTLAGLGCLLLGIRGLRDPCFVAAILCQMALSMVSLNYKNPVIVVTLMLFWPKASSDAQEQDASKWLSTLWLIPLLGVVWIDYFRAQHAEKTAWQQVSRLFPAHRAQLAGETNQFVNAWADQKRALRWDPHGPETIFNTGVIAWKLGEAGDPAGFTIAIRAFLLNRLLHPEYRPARDRLIEIKNADRWQDAWSQLEQEGDLNEVHQRWFRDVLSWQVVLDHSKSLQNLP